MNHPGGFSRRIYHKFVKATTNMAYVADSFMVYDHDDNMTVNVTLIGVPVAQPRPRIKRLSNNRVIVYDPSQPKKTKCRSAVRLSLQEIGINQRPIFSGQEPLSVTAYFYVSSNAKDLDNMLKFLLDVLEGPVYLNDSSSSICHIEAHKILCPSAEQKTRVVIENV